VRDRSRYFWHLHNRRQLKLQGHYEARINTAIKNQYRSFVREVEINGYEYAKKNLFTIVKFTEVAEIIKDLYLKSAYVESNYVLNYLRRKGKNKIGQIERKAFAFETKRVRPRFGIGFDDLAPIIDQYFQIYLLNNSALPITATTRNIIIKHLINEVDSGKPLARALEDFTDLAITGGSTLSLPRAVMIARTESTRAMSFGGMLGAYMTGIDVDKVWVTSDDERVRVHPYSHVALDMSEVDMKGAFYNREYIRFPGDPKASIQNTANCRCAMFFKEKDDPDKEEIRDIRNFLIDIFSTLFIGVAAEMISEN
jgi:hypothetical protein